MLEQKMRYKILIIFIHKNYKTLNVNRAKTKK